MCVDFMEMFCRHSMISTQDVPIEGGVINFFHSIHFICNTFILTPFLIDFNQCIFVVCQSLYPDEFR